MIGSVQVFGRLTTDTARLVLIKDFSNSSKFKLREYVSSKDNNLQLKFASSSSNKKKQTKYPYLTILVFIL